MNRITKLLLLCVFAFPAQARDNWALLVGVSEYPSLGPERQLRGPRNDVIALRDTLHGMQGEWRRMIVLADGVPESDGMPTRAAITGNLERLAREVKPGDFVVVYFGGHGSQQPAAADREEVDGLDEIFLPRDIGRWDGKIGSVRNALTDNEVRRLLHAILAAGAQVWAVFDSCHSGTMTRGGTGALLAGAEVQRAVRPAELGVPLFSARTARTISAASRGQRAWSEKLVVFSAAQSDQSTPELRLPVGDPARVEHGLFTYTLLRALRANGATSYGQLAQSIATRYAIMQRSSPTPLFEGVLQGAVPLAATTAPPLDLHAAPVRLSEPGLCARDDASAPCDERAAPGDPALRAQVAKWLTEAANPASNIRRVAHAGDADIALIVRGGRVWFVATADDYRVGGRRPPSVADAAAFAESLGAIVNVQRLFTLAERPSAPLALSVAVHRSARGAGDACKTPQSSQLDFAGAPQSLRAGESLCMVLTNTGSVPLDVTLLHVGADYSVQPLFPLRSETNRIAAATERRIALEIVAEETAALDRVVALAVDVQGEEIVDFSWVSQPGIERSVRGAGGASRPLWMQTLRWIAQPARGSP